MTSYPQLPPPPPTSSILTDDSNTTSNPNSDSNKNKNKRKRRKTDDGQSLIHGDRDGSPDSKRRAVEELEGWGAYVFRNFKRMVGFGLSGGESTSTSDGQALGNENGNENGDRSGHAGRGVDRDGSENGQTEAGGEGGAGGYLGKMGLGLGSGSKSGVNGQLPTPRPSPDGSLLLGSDRTGDSSVLAVGKENGDEEDSEGIDGISTASASSSGTTLPDEPSTSISSSSPPSQPHSNGHAGPSKIHLRPYPTPLTSTPHVSQSQSQPQSQSSRHSQSQSQSQSHSRTSGDTTRPRKGSPRKGKEKDRGRDAGNGRGKGKEPPLDPHIPTPPHTQGDHDHDHDDDHDHEEEEEEREGDEEEEEEEEDGAIPTIDLTGDSSGSGSNTSSLTHPDADADANEYLGGPTSPTSISIDEDYPPPPPPLRQSRIQKGSGGFCANGNEALTRRMSNLSLGRGSGTAAGGRRGLYVGEHKRTVMLKRTRTVSTVARMVAPNPPPVLERSSLSEQDLRRLLTRVDSDYANSRSLLGRDQLGIFAAQSRPQPRLYLPSSGSSQKIEPIDRVLSRARASYSSPGPRKPSLPYWDGEREKQMEQDRFYAAPKIRKRKWPVKLTAEQLQVVNNALKKSGSISEVQGIGGGSIEIFQKDLSKLRPGQWLNDEVVNFFALLINNRSTKIHGTDKERAGWSEEKKAEAGKSEWLNVHAFNSFFMGQLADEKKGYKSVARWSKKFDVFAKDLIIVPVNVSNTHWTCSAINIKKKRFEYYDSMDGKGKKYIKHLREYVTKEWEDKKKGKEPIDLSEWEDYWDDSMPQQTNGVDCGVFVTQVMDVLSRKDFTFDFGQANMTFMRTKLIYEIATKGFMPDEWE